MSTRLTVLMVIGGAFWMTACGSGASDSPSGELITAEAVGGGATAAAGLNTGSNDDDTSNESAAAASANTPQSNAPITPVGTDGNPTTPANANNDDTCAPASPFGTTDSTPWTPPANCTGLFAEFGEYPVGMARLGTDENPMAVWYPGEIGSEAQRAKAIYDMRNWLPQELNIPPEACTFFQMEAYENLPAAAGQYPVVVFSHGIAGYRFQSSAIMNHLASWGFIVVAPEHPERNLAAVLETGTISGDNAIQAMRDALMALSDAHSDASSPLEGRVDLTRIASSGHSMGAAAASTIAADVDVKTWFVMASPGFTNVDAKPILVMGGTTDAIATPAAIEGAFGNLTATPRRYVSIDKAGHLAFSDICLVARSKGGVLGLAEEYGIEIVDLLSMLGRDGCRETDRAPETVFPVIGHYLVAHLRAGFGIDAELGGFDETSRNCFGDAVADIVVIDEGDVPTEDGPAGELEGVGKICCGSSGAGCDLATEKCCSSWIGQSCRVQCNETFELTQVCDGAEDCPRDYVCCKKTDATVPSSFGSTCRAACALDEQPMVSTNSCEITSNPGGTPGVPGSGMGGTPMPNPNQTPGVAGIVSCGDIECAIDDNLCCVDVQGNFSCEANDQCGQGAAPQACDGPEDCDGQQCCAGFPAGASCKAGCGNFELEICHTDADCGASGQCAPCNPPGTTVNACSCPF